MYNFCKGWNRPLTLLLMLAEISISVPKDFSFRSTATSHGWYDLPPFSLDEERMSLRYVFRDGGRPIVGTIRESARGLVVRCADRPVSKKSIVAQVRHILRLDEDYGDFYERMCAGDRFSWVREIGAGRLLRSATVFEDLVKTMCTTNCSWGLTRKMVGNLVTVLGDSTSDGVYAFPAADAMAARDEAFYRNEIRAGYRSPYFIELAERVASGRIDPERWLDLDIPTADLKKQLKAVKGIGDYAAENMLKLLGRYDGLALDSWLRSQFYKKHNRGRRCADKKIERHYGKYGKWRGLAIWCDMTEEWHFNPRPRV